MGQADESPEPTQIGRYQVRSKIGSGGMGVVYATYDPALDREVAVKLIRPDRLAGNREAATLRLQHEARSTAKLAHPNVVTVYDVGQHERSIYIAMELVHGPSLRQWMTETARPWREVLSMFFGAGLGLASAHDIGLIHRDFKPSNVLVGTDHRPRVVDFGLARTGGTDATLPPDLESDAMSTAPGRVWSPDADPVETEDDVLSTLPSAADSFVQGQRAKLLSTQQSVSGDPDASLVGPGPGVEGPTRVSPEVTTTNAFVGTPAYMAPELFLGQGADAKSDQFAYCVSLFEGLYGYRPFAGTTVAAIAEEVLSGNIVDVAERNRVPRWVHNIIVRGLARDPRDRHPSVRSLLASIAFTARIMWE